MNRESVLYFFFSGILLCTHSFFQSLCLLLNKATLYLIPKVLDEFRVNNFGIRARNESCLKSHHESNHIIPACGLLLMEKCLGTIEAAGLKILVLDSFSLLLLKFLDELVFNLLKDYY